MTDEGLDLESWPLLRPDQISQASDDLLQRSLLALTAELLKSDIGAADPLSGYAQKQKQRILEVLQSRTAAARVAALLTGTRPTVVVQIYQRRQQS